MKEGSVSMKKDLRLICPQCRTSMGSYENMMGTCSNCSFELKQCHGVPVLRTVNEAENIDLVSESSTLPVMNSANIRVPFVQDSLNSGKLTLEIGAGVDCCEYENLVKTDAFVYSKDLDFSVDAHAMPFEDNTFDYVYSLAVFEHLHTPWDAAKEIFRVLKPGGKVYVLSAFNQHMHGYPHHYFNMTDSGLKRIFEDFVDVECNPSPFCPLEQVSVSLLDLLEMVEMLEKSDSSAATSKMKNSIMGIIKTMPELQSKLIHTDEAFDAWRRIAPGFDLYGTKPLSL